MRTSNTRKPDSLAKGIAMGQFEKKCPDEILRYRPPNLSAYAGQRFCLRITLGYFDLDSCFFVYLDESCESLTIRSLFKSFFTTSNPANIRKMKSLLDARIDPNIHRKYWLLRKLFQRAASKECEVTFHINNGPSNFDLRDTVADHLGTSVWTDGRYNDKILDIVLVFTPRPSSQLPPELLKWKQLGLIHGSEPVYMLAGEGDRRDFSEQILGWMIVAAVAFPLLLWYACSQDDDTGESFSGGAL
jgi:hypothetical protein